MGLQIIIRNKNKWRGRNISEMASNLESTGWPSEFSSEEARDKVKWLENKERRPVTKRELLSINKPVKPKGGKVIGAIPIDS